MDCPACLIASNRVCQVLGLKHVPDHTTLQRTHKKLRQRDLQQMKNRLLEALGVEEDVIPADSTGFSPGQASW